MKEEENVEEVEEEEENVEEVEEENVEEEEEEVKELNDELVNELEDLVSSDEEDNNSEEEKDLLTLFLKKHVLETKDDTFVRYSDMYNLMTEWYDENNFTQDLPDKKIVKGELKKKYGKSSKGGWKGLKLINVESDEEN